MTPYEAVCGQNSLSMVFYLLGTSKIHAMDKTLCTREVILYILKYISIMEQIRMEQQVD